MRRAPGLALLLAACASRGSPPPPPDRAAADTDPLAAFAPRGEPVVEELALDPDGAWRFVVSRVTTVRAEAQALGEELLLTFEEGAVHRTRRGGSRRTWALPPGLRLTGGPCHLLFGPELSGRLLREGEVAAGEDGWTLVVAARVAGRDGNVAEFRLEAKGGREFRSIQTAG